MGCDSARRWLASSGVGQTDQVAEDSAAFAAHVAKCAECTALLRRYEAFTTDCRVACSHELDAEAEARFLSAAEGLTAHTTDYPSIVEALREKLDHKPSEVAEPAFLDAARRQRHAETSGPGRPRRAWKPLVAVASAAAAVLAVVVWNHSTSGPGPGMSGPRFPTEPEQQTVAVASHSGRVLVDDEPLAGDQGAIARAGTTISTGEASHVEIHDGSDAWITVDSESNVEIVEWRPQAARLLLRLGTVRAKVTHRESDELFEIATPSARVTVVGTEFSVTHTALGSTTVNATSGTVRVERKDGSLAGFVSAGATLRVDAEVAVTEPPTTSVVARAPQSPSRNEPPADVDSTIPEGEEEPPSSPDEGAKPGDETATRAATPLQRARSLLAEGEVDKAITLLLDMPAADWRRDALLGDAYQLAGQYRAAEKAYRDCLTKVAQPPASILADLASLQETRLKNSKEAARTWRRYLDEYPDGGDAARAHLTAGRAALGAGEDRAAKEHFRIILDRFPRARESTAALALLGGHLLKQERWSEAEALFVRPYAKSIDAETSLVGLIRVRIAQGDQEAAASLISGYWQKFPTGLRRDEVKRLEHALGSP